MFHTLLYALLVASFVIAIGVARLVGGGWVWLLTTPSLFLIGYTAFKLMHHGGKPKPPEVDAHGRPILRPVHWVVAFTVHHPKIAVGLMLVAAATFGALAIAFPDRGGGGVRWS